MNRLTSKDVRSEWNRSGWALQEIRRMRTGRPRRLDAFLCGAVASIGVIANGCAPKSVTPVRVTNESLGPLTIAVAPALNVSGTEVLDPNRVADLMAVELSYVDGVQVIPVNRVLAGLANQGKSRIESAEHALQTAQMLGADAILVFAVTEYDPYDPPVVGIAAQLYGRRRDPRLARFDPVAESRRASPSGRSPGDSPLAPLAEAEQVFDASHEWVSQEVRRFAEARDADASPFGWRKYLASQQHYLRFCCNQTIRSLMAADGHREVPDSKAASP